MARADFGAAVAHFKAAHQLRPTATGPLLALGMAYRANGDCKSALPHLRDYLKRKLAAGISDARHGLRFLRKSARRARLRRALERLTRRE